jgi:MoaA/NifB/PqqE/SkfB family radical SAM enzyme
MLETLINHFKLQQYQSDKTRHPLRELDIELTGGCNLSCRHCHMSAQSGGSADDITCEQWIRFFEFIKNRYGSHVRLNITGGEPLIRKDIAQILYHLKKMGFIMSLATNGVKLDYPTIKLIDDCIDTLEISLDGFEESHNKLRQQNVYQKLVKNMVTFQQQSSVPILVKSAITKHNFNEIEELYEFLYEMGITAWHFYPVEPLGRANTNSEYLLTQEEYAALTSYAKSLVNNPHGMEIFFEQTRVTKSFESSVKDKMCRSGITSCAIYHNGDIAKCIQDNREHTYKRGNIVQDDFADVWETKFDDVRSSGHRYCGNHYYIQKCKTKKSNHCSAC